MKKVIITVVVIALLASICVFTLTGCSKLNEWKDKFIELINPEDGSSNETEEGAFTVIVDEKQNEAVIQEGIVLEKVLYSGTSISNAFPGTQIVDVIATVGSNEVQGYEVNWNLSFANASSVWASGKNTEDYIICNISEDTLTCALTCVQPFGEQIILTASVAVSPSVKATCVLDFNQKLSNSDSDYVLSTSNYDDFFLSETKPYSVSLTNSDVEETFTFENVIKINGFHNYFWVNGELVGAYDAKILLNNIGTAYTNESLARIVNLNYTIELSDEFYNSLLESYGSARKSTSGGMSGNVNYLYLCDIYGAMVSSDGQAITDSRGMQYLNKFNKAAASVIDNTEAYHIKLTINIQYAASYSFEAIYYLKLDSTGSLFSADSIALNNSSYAF